MADTDPDLTSTQERILRVLDEADDRVNTKNLRERFTEWFDDMTRQNISAQTKALDEMDLVKKVGVEDVGAPSPANVYRITIDGSSVVADLDYSPTAAEIADRFGEFEQRLDEIDDRLDAVEDQVGQSDEIEAQIQKIADAETVLRDSLVAAGIEIQSGDG